MGKANKKTEKELVYKKLFYISVSVLVLVIFASAFLVINSESSRTST